MRVTVIKIPLAVREKYPWVGKYVNGDVEIVVLFTARNAGMCLASNNNHTAGHTSKMWKESDYTPTTIEISSEGNA